MSYKNLQLGPEITLTRLQNSPQQSRALQELFEAAPGYFEKVTGMPAEKDKAEELLSKLPEGKSLEDKFVYGFDANGELIACADIIRGYPEVNASLLGLFLLPEIFQRKGLGKHCYQLLEERIREWNCNRIWLSVIKVNDTVMPFWEKMGFMATGEIRTYSNNAIVSEAVLMEKKL